MLFCTVTVVCVICCLVFDVWCLVFSVLFVVYWFVSVVFLLFSLSLANLAGLAWPPLAQHNGPHGQPPWAHQDMQRQELNQKAICVLFAASRLLSVVFDVCCSLFVVCRLALVVYCVLCCFCCCWLLFVACL